MTDFSSIEILQTPSAQVMDLTANVWKRFRRHRAAIAGAVVLSVLATMTIFAFLSPYDPERSDLDVKFQAPSASHPLGTDALGRVNKPAWNMR